MVAVKGDANGVAYGVARGHGVGIFFAIVAGVYVAADGEFNGGEVFVRQIVERDGYFVAVARHGEQIAPAVVGELVGLGAQFAVAAAALLNHESVVSAAHPCGACFVVGGGEQG